MSLYLSHCRIAFGMVKQKFRQECHLKLRDTQKSDDEIGDVNTINEKNQDNIVCQNYRNYV